MSIYKTKYREPLDAWGQFWSEFVDIAESCYLRWINCDDEMTEQEEALAVAYQEYVESLEGEGDLIDVEIPPDIDVTPEELEAFMRVLQKLQKSGLSSLLNAVIGATFTVDTRVF